MRILHVADTHTPPQEALAAVSRLNAEGRNTEAAELLRKFQLEYPDNPDLLYEYGKILHELDQPEKAAECFRIILSNDPYDVSANIMLASILKDKPLEALHYFRRGCRLAPDQGIIHLMAGVTALDADLRHEARGFFEKALEIDTDNISARLLLCMTLLKMFRDEEELEAGRFEYSRALDDLIEHTPLDTPDDIKKAFEASGMMTSFFLPYQGRNDRDLQRKYGAWLSRIMAASFPDIASVTATPLMPGEKLRVGIVSGHFFDHAVWRIVTRGWLEHLDRSRFMLFGYYSGDRIDDATETARRFCDVFVRNTSINALAEIISQHKPHVLIYPGLSMDPHTLRLAAIRLAPVQCASWGHPVTTGLPTMDYFLSSDLMEPPDADGHYTEQLVRLPNLSICYDPILHPEAPPLFSVPGVDAADISFLCCQNLMKYLPRYDDVFPAIASQVRNAKFIFISAPNSYSRCFLERQTIAFDKLGMSAADHIVFVPPLSRADYAGLNAAADIYLDSIGWSGGNTTFESLIFNKPLVTLPGEFMRGRHTVAILKMMGVEEIIASSKQEYVDIAVRLAHDLDWRAAVSERIADNKHRAYNDHECIFALEAFLEKAYREATCREPRIQAEKLSLEGNHTAAEQLYRDLLREAPLDSELHNSLATVLDMQGRYVEAIAHYNKALLLNPRLVVARYNLANTLRRTGDDAGAMEPLLQAVKDEPDFIAAWKSLAMLHIAHDAYAEAANCFEKLVALNPLDIESRCALGNMYAETGRFSDAVACFEGLLALQPGHLLTLESLGTVLHELDELERAEDCFRRVLACEPDRVTVLNNLGTVLRSAARVDEAIELFDYALSLSPENSQIRFNRVIARLARGEMPQAWDEYETRFETRSPTRLMHTDLPRWGGEPLNGRCLLVQSEQGFGDTFQFVRYLPLLAHAGGPVVFECQNASVLQAIKGIQGVTVFARGEALPHIDCQIPLVSLPYLFQTDVATIPFPRGYLTPPTDAVEIWKNILAEDSNLLKVGLVWGGNKYSLNANRSLHLAQLSQLFKLPGIRWYSLQLGPDAEQLAGFREQIVDLGPQIHDFGDTAAIIANLDLVLTIDSAVAHLAGALGVPVWVMLKYSPDWRWLLGCSDNHWYASARLFRQQAPGDWGSVARSVKDALEIFSHPEN
jgi:predicted O-linked N-acetylglucosamine transferase (SPINDLY family)